MSINIKYKAHIGGVGWQPEVEDGQIAGTVGESKPLEAFIITQCSDPDINFHIFTHVANKGWLDGVTMGYVAGTTGESLQMEAFYIGVIGENANNYDIWYRGHVQDYGFLEWSKNGEINGTVGGGKRLEAIQIEVHKKNENWYPRVDTNKSYINLAKTPVINYAERLVNQARAHEGYISGTSMDSAFGRRYGLTGNWCMFFVKSVCDDVGVEIPLCSGSCPDLWEWAKKNGKAVSTPQVGYAVLYDFNHNSVPDHIGIVESITGNGVVAIEGNTGSPVGVYRKTRNNSDIVGYIKLYE